MLSKEDEVKIVEYYFLAATEALLESGGDASMENSLYHALDFIAEDVKAMRKKREDYFYWFTKMRRERDAVKEEVFKQSRISNYQRNQA